VSTTLFSPAAFGVVAADGDYNIIGEPMIVHCLVVPFCRLATYRVKGPIQLVQIDIRGQWAERTSLRNPELSSDVDNLLHEMQDLRVLDPLRDFV
jgi:exonuclease I